MNGVLASALIIAVCGAGLHTIVNMRRREAKDWRTPFWDGPRKVGLLFAAVIGGGYAAFVTIAVLAGW